FEPGDRGTAAGPDAHRRESGAEADHRGGGERPHRGSSPLGTGWRRAGGQQLLEEALGVVVRCCFQEADGPCGVLWHPEAAGVEAREADPGTHLALGGGALKIREDLWVVLWQLSSDAMVVDGLE